MHAGSRLVQSVGFAFWQCKWGYSCISLPSPQVSYVKQST